MVLTIGELARALDARCWGDASIAVTGAAEPASVGPAGPEGGVLAMAMAPKYAERLTPGSIAILAEGMDPEAYGLKAAIFAPRPRLLMAGLTRAFDPGPDIAPGIHPTAVIDHLVAGRIPVVSSIAPDLDHPGHSLNVNADAAAAALAIALGARAISRHSDRALVKAVIANARAQYR